MGNRAPKREALLPMKRSIDVSEGADLHLLSLAATHRLYLTLPLSPRLVTVSRSRGSWAAGLSLPVFLRILSESEREREREREGGRERVRG